MISGSFVARCAAWHEAQPSASSDDEMCGDAGSTRAARRYSGPVTGAVATASWYCAAGWAAAVMDGGTVSTIGGLGRIVTTAGEPAATVSAVGRRRNA